MTKTRAQISEDYRLRNDLVRMELYVLPANRERLKQLAKDHSCTAGAVLGKLLDAWQPEEVLQIPEVSKDTAPVKLKSGASYAKELLEQAGNDVVEARRLFMVNNREYFPGWNPDASKNSKGTPYYEAERRYNSTFKYLPLPDSEKKKRNKKK